jgi:hypothetical protein
VGGFRDTIAVSMCRHERHDEPDEYGAALCFACEQRVPIVLTEKALMRAFNEAARAFGMREPFDGEA